MRVALWCRFGEARACTYFSHIWVASTLPHPRKFHFNFPFFLESSSGGTIPHSAAFLKRRNAGRVHHKPAKLLQFVRLAVEAGSLVAAARGYSFRVGLSVLGREGDDLLRRFDLMCNWERRQSRWLPLRLTALLCGTVGYLTHDRGRTVRAVSAKCREMPRTRSDVKQAHLNRDGEYVAQAGRTASQKPRNHISLRDADTAPENVGRSEIELFQPIAHDELALHARLNSLTFQGGGKRAASAS